MLFNPFAKTAKTKAAEARISALNEAFSDTVPDTQSDTLPGLLPDTIPVAVMPSSLEIEALLRSARTIAIVGLSPKPHRDSHDVAKYLQAAGYRILPVNPVVAASDNPFILGEPCYPSLTEASYSLDPGEHIDIVNIFRKSDDVPPVVEKAVVLGAQSIWLQLGIRHDPVATFAKDLGLVVVQDRCIKIEHSRVMR